MHILFIKKLLLYLTENGQRQQERVGFHDISFLTKKKNNIVNFL